MLEVAASATAYFGLTLVLVFATEAVTRGRGA